jgi:glycosyltransferase involved in cell wall biosynthesis
MSYNFNKLRSVIFDLRSYLIADLFLLYSIHFSFIELFFYKRNKIDRKDKLNIIHINTDDCSGGAAKVARDLMKIQIENGHNVKLLVGEKKNSFERIIEIPKHSNKILRFLNNAQKKRGWIDIFHSSHFNLFKMKEFKEADIVHLHNLHGGYFSYLSIIKISKMKKVVWSLHDCQAFTGHCSYSLECERWKNGCGSCPDLTIYPKLNIDSTKILIKLKKNIYKKSKIEVVALSEWLKKQVEKSILKNQKINLIYNGIDDTIYHPYNKVEVRNEFNLPLNKIIVMFSANLGIANPFKGGGFARTLIDENNDKSMLFINIGGDKDEKISENCWNVSYIKDSMKMAKYFSASDIYLYPSIADNCPLVALEAMACNTSILTFNTGGIPELVTHLKNGYIANYKDLDDLKKGLNFLIDEIKTHKNENFSSIKKNSNEYNLNLMYTKYLNIY